VIVAGVPLWFAQTNCFVVAPERGAPGVLVDAPPDPAGVARIVEQAGVVPVALLLTHGHVDHVGGSRDLATRYSVSAYLHPDDDWLAKDLEGQLRDLFGMVPPGEFAPPERFVQLGDGQVLDLAGLSFEVMHTPGHTPGHCCFRLASEGVLFGGDLLFAGSIGRTDLPGGDFDTMMRSIADLVANLPPETEVFPGHGPTTTLARELQTNPFLQAFRT
jgi:glyoxylase-like metal-dependent hydrolase (beta-lactamase superfamily II)